MTLYDLSFSIIWGWGVTVTVDAVWAGVAAAVWVGAEVFVFWLQAGNIILIAIIKHKMAKYLIFKCSSQIIFDFIIKN
jgi:hypothetical protein